MSASIPQSNGRVKKQKFTSKKLSKSSRAYLERQAADPYVHAARAQGYRSRAAFKLRDINDKYKLIRSGQPINIIDLGCAPGGWCQVATQISGPQSTVVGMDLLEVDPLAQCTFLKGDFSTDEGLALLLQHLPRRVDGSPALLHLILSDMAANTIGHRASDGLRTMVLVEMAVDFVIRNLAPGGHFITKIFLNGDEPKLRDTLRPHFEKVVFFKPPSSRKESRETFLIAINRLTAPSDHPLPTV